MHTYEQILADLSILNSYRSRALIPISCFFCTQEFEISKNRLQSKISKNHSHLFCSNSCHAKYKSDKNSTSLQCDQCNCTIVKINSSISRKNFCSKSCATKFNNKLYPKRKMSGTCLSCEATISGSRKYCSKCFKLEKRNDWDSMTMQYMKDRYGVNRYSIIRTLARKAYKDSGGARECLQCKYKTHIEICHITPIASFDADATLYIVNNLSNLVALCPNHHWELDNKVLKLFR